MLAGAAAACTAPAPVVHAERIISRAGQPDRLERVQLPDWLGVGDRTEASHVRYRIDVSACANQPAATLWLYRLGAVYAVRDGAQRQPLAQLTAGGRLQLEDVLGPLAQIDPPVYNGRIPSLFELPPGARQVEIELLTLPYFPSGLVAAELGPAPALVQRQAVALESVVAFADAASGVVLVLGGLALLLWTQRRSDHALLWLAVACGLWGVRGVAYYGPVVPMDPTWFEQFNPLNVLLASMALTASVLSLLQLLTRARYRLLLGATGVCVLALVAATLAGRGGLQARSACQAVGFVMVTSLIPAVWRARSRLVPWQAPAFIATLVALLACALHDLLVVAGVLSVKGQAWVFWGFVVMLISFAGISGQYVVSTLNRAERSNEELERHVARKTQELEQSYAQLRENEREAARTQERERLLREMHDGLGAQLMTALRAVERGALGPHEVAASLQDGLDELRMLMDSSDMGGYLPGALAAWRNRWDARIAAAGIQLHWHIDESVDDAQLPGDTALHLLRILQEAATNVVKHAKARHLHFDARVKGEGAARELCITIADDGQGLPEGGARAGSRGLDNMRHRARQIGARLAIGAPPAGRGTLLALQLPISSS